MAPIICFATGISGTFLPGIRVLLYCYDRKSNPTLQFFGYTDEYKSVSTWYAASWPVHSYQEPVVVNAFKYLRVRITFFTRDYFRSGLYP